MGGSARNPRRLHLGPGKGTVQRVSLFRDQAFRNMFIAAAVSAGGTQVSFVAIPLMAVMVLNARSADVGVLGVVKSVALPFCCPGFRRASGWTECGCRPAAPIGRTRS